ncbi:glycosyltransferase family 2 protein [Pelotomaculum isophthalicicum JI]|uniref:Glycosyltransferase family 2 protein n=1 Tax=Pelotomaculum isophthalicicum JI TaxID=947010 RepID=A0A9X4H4Y0_9FIRM|nr:glycosyltransferase family 2 protein [Pelotomaculum isophthalicicum]MDF9407169.1 glycosyltransferase family 2 protein [Pelotomaculum isophthalicicum JI]
MKKNVRHTIIIPVYNEEAVINETYRRLTRVMESTGEPYELLFVNDGSRDRTAELIEGFAESDGCVKLLDFSRNFGHQIAITAGMDYARGEAIVIIDADLQDPPELIPLMIDKWKEGYEVVYAQRSKRKGETLFKKWTAAMFYRTLRALTEVNIPLDTGDFRLIDRKVCDAMRSVREKNRFVRGLVSWVGFRSTAIEYVREERFAGETKYPLKKMLRFSLDGITSFSHKPLKLATYLGFVISFASFIYLVVSVAQRLFNIGVVAGWSPLVACLLLLDGVVLIILGILGEYVGRIYDETKNRPLYILRNKQEVEEAKPEIEVICGVL